MKRKQLKEIIQELSTFLEHFKLLEKEGILPENLDLNSIYSCAIGVAFPSQDYITACKENLPSLQIPQSQAEASNTLPVYKLVWPLFYPLEGSRINTKEWIMKCSHTIKQLTALYDLKAVYKKVKKFAKTNPNYVFNMTYGFTCVLGTLYKKEFPSNPFSWTDIRKAYFSSILICNDSENNLVKEVSNLFYPKEQLGGTCSPIGQWLEECEKVLNTLSTTRIITIRLPDI